MKTSASITAVAPALVAAGADLGPVIKDATNPAFRNRYATLDAIMEQVRPVLAKHKLAVCQGVVHPETADGRLLSLSVETTILHASGEWIATSVALPVEKVTAQGVGSAISYGRRYGLSAMLGLTAEDDDGNAASVPSAVAAPAKAAPASTPEPGKRLYENVPDTPRRKPFSGNFEEALKTPFPFKKDAALAGKPLGEIPPAKLEATRDWCRKTDEAKFADLIHRIEAVLQYFMEMDEEQRSLDQAEAERDDIPF